MKALLPLAALLAAPLAHAQTYSGTLANGDATRDNNARYDAYEVTLRQGQQFTVKMTSADFDTYLILKGPKGVELSNDDFGSTAVSQISGVASEGGTWTVWASAYNEEGTGAYEVQVNLGGIANIETVEGRLDPRDEQLPKGEYADTITRSISSASPFTIELHSFGFDGYLIVKSPSGQVWRNDDEGSTNLSRVSDLPVEAGDWTIYVTSAGAEEVGAYDLRLITF